MGTKDQLNSDLAAAMRQGDKETRDTLRMLLAAVKQVEKDDQKVLDDEDVQMVLFDQAKRRRESIHDARAAGRPDLVSKEESELRIIESYLPKMLTEDEIRPIAAEIIQDLNASGMRDMGKVMNQLLPQLRGKADGKLVSNVVRSLLQSK